MTGYKYKTKKTSFVSRSQPYMMASVLPSAVRPATAVAASVCTSRNDARSKPARVITSSAMSLSSSCSNTTDMNEKIYSTEVRKERMKEISCLNYVRDRTTTDKNEHL